MDVFSPLSKEYCLYFYVLSIIGFVGLVLGVIVFTWITIVKKKGFDYIIKAIFVLGIYFLMYFQNRLFYGMCSK
jgi:hypothetical protein